MKGSQSSESGEMPPSRLILFVTNWSFNLILEWLDLVHLGLLDIAVANPREIRIWRSCLHQIDSQLFDEWKHSHNSIRWALKRNLRLTIIQIDVRHKRQINNRTFEGIDMPSLKSVNLDGCSCFADAGLECLVRGRIQSNDVFSRVNEYIKNNGDFALRKGCPNLRDLNISMCKVSDIGLKAVSQGCPNLQSFTYHFTFEGEGVTDSSLVTLAQGCPKLDNLDISHFRKVTDVSIVAIAQHCPLLNTIRLPGISISALSLSALSTGCRHLLEIKLDSSCISEESVMSLASSLPLLKVLDVYGCRHVSDVCVEHIAQSCRHLETIALPSTYLTSRSLIAIGTYSTFLRSLHMSVSQIGDDGLIAVAIGCPELRTLTISDCLGPSRFTAVGLAAIAQGCKKLQKVCMRDCRELLETGYISLALGLSNLEHLNLQGCTGATDATLLAIAQCPYLKFLSIPGGEFSSNGFLRLADGCPLLEEVTFSYQRLLTDDALQSIAANCSGLRSIRLNHCVNISDTGVSALSACRSLELITLDHCSITDASLLALANIPGLRSVNVSNCLAVTDTGVRALVRGCALLHIEIQYNTNITDGLLFSIEKNCPNIILLDVSYCTKITDEGIEPLLRSAPTMQLNTLGCGIKHGGNKCHN